MQHASPSSAVDVTPILFGNEVDAAATAFRAEDPWAEDPRAGGTGVAAPAGGGEGLEAQLTPA